VQITEDPNVKIKNELAKSLELLKWEILDTVVEDTAEFLLFLN